MLKNDAEHTLSRTEKDAALQKRLSASTHGVVHEHCAEELASRLPLLAFDADKVICHGWDASMAEQLLQRWPNTELTVVESNPTLAARARQAARRWLRSARFKVVNATLQDANLASASVDFVVSNLTMARNATPDDDLAVLSSALRAGGGLLLALPGPNTLREVRHAWADGATHAATFADMHDLGSALSRHRFTESVLNAVPLTLVYSDPKKLWRDLDEHGARNSEPDRPRGLTSRRRFDQMLSALREDDGRIQISIELVFAQCWRAHAQSRDRNLQDGEIRVDITQISRR